MPEHHPQASTSSSPASSPYTTPLMQQYERIKREYADCLVLFRLGDFYELFAEDAKIGSRILDITLTRKAQSKGGDVPMAGIPYHAIETYLPRLVQAGFKVALVEQVGEVNTKTIVERAVVRIVTPGTILAEGGVATKQNQFVLAYSLEGETLSNIGLALADLTTGELLTTQIQASSPKEAYTLWRDTLTQYQPKEIIFPPETSPEVRTQLENIAVQTGISCFTVAPEWPKSLRAAQRTLMAALHVSTLQAFGLDQWPLATFSSAGLIQYLSYTQRQPIEHLRSLRTYHLDESVHLDRATMLHLELFTTAREGKTNGSLLAHLDHTHTAAGGRLLRHWLQHPLRQAGKIHQRQESIAFFLSKTALHQQIVTELKQVGDLERLTSRVALNLTTPREILRLAQSLRSALRSLHLLEKDGKTPAWITTMTSISTRNTLETLTTTLEKTLCEEPAADPKNGHVIRSGVDPELDIMRRESTSLSEWMLELERSERAASGIPTLKVRSNKVFGFYLEISSAQLHKVPAHYERKQTLVNGERFVTSELKQKELQLLHAESQRHERELLLFRKLLHAITELTAEIQLLSHQVATLDVLLSLTEVATTQRYQRPEIGEPGSRLEIHNGRHPVVETWLTDTAFVPNDTRLDETYHLQIVTGPNMAGKSVYMRQVALITLMAHLGSFVPAEYAHIPLVDRIFVRSGASDAISEGLSTFMVEMVETAHILHHCSDQSLVIMDEIGRGTSTYDGVSIAWAVAEYLATTPGKKAKTLFATHYHELQELAEHHQSIQNVQVAVEEHVGELVFLHRVVPGGASHSFGVAVAKLAGLPDTIITRSQKKLATLETPAQHQPAQNEQTLQHDSRKQGSQSDWLGLALEKLDIAALTPLQALTTLAEWQERTRHGKH